MAGVKQERKNYIKFLGTAGARFVMIKQLRASGGLWVSSGETNILIDPGPGSIVRRASSRPKLDPGKLDAIILTHRHLDHANDINVMIEAFEGERVGLKRVHPGKWEVNFGPWLAGELYDVDTGGIRAVVHRKKKKR